MAEHNGGSVRLAPGQGGLPSVKRVLRLHDPAGSERLRVVWTARPFERRLSSSGARWGHTMESAHRRWARFRMERRETAVSAITSLLGAGGRCRRVSELFDEPQFSDCGAAEVGFAHGSVVAVPGVFIHRQRPLVLLVGVQVRLLAA